jgi:ketosteroid isomerase-like protein
MTMSVKDIAVDLIALCNAGAFLEAGDKYWADDVVSIEPMGPTLETAGKAAVRGKGEWFAANHEITGFTASGPYLHGDQFAVRFVADLTFKATGERRTMDEIGLYTVKDGKIVEERFLFGG